MITSKYTILRRSLSTCITGIGNPEPQYAMSRHNAGLLMLDLLKQQLQPERKAYVPCNANPKVKRCQIDGLLLLRADGDYINLSGRTVVPLWHKLGSNVKHVVVHDELSLPVGKVQLRNPGTSVRGHNGLKDIKTRYGDAFYRLAIGIGRPDDRDPNVVANYVLSRFPPHELAVIESDSLILALRLLQKAGLSA